MSEILELPVAPSSGGGVTEAELLIDPSTTNWNRRFNDFASKPESSSVNKTYGGGTIGLSSFASGTSASLSLSPTTYAKRYGVVSLNLGTSAGSIVAFELADDKAFRFGDGRIVCACSLKPLQSISGTEDYTLMFGIGNAISTFSTQGAHIYLGNFYSATNWQIKNDGSSLSVIDSGVAYNTIDFQALKIDVAADLSSVKYYIGGVLVHTETTAANIPAAGTQANFQITKRVHGSVTAINKTELDWAYLDDKPSAARDTLSARPT